MYLILIIIRRMNIIKCKKQEISFETYTEFIHEVFYCDYFKSLVTILRLKYISVEKMLVNSNLIIGTII